MRLVLAFLAASTLALLAPGAASGEATSRRVCSFTNVKTIGESSGVVASSTRDDVVFTHNDSGDTARFFAVDTACRLLATYVLPIPKPTDTEDIARAQGSIWLADIGDNAARRASVVVNRVPEPAPDPSRTGVTVATAPPQRYTFTYPDGAHDAETLLVSPQGRLWIVTKSFFGAEAVYEAPQPLRPGTTAQLKKVADVPASIGVLTGGDLSADGTRLVLRTYTDAYEWDLAGTDVAAAIGKRRARETPLPQEPQGEGIGFTRDGRDWWLTSESAGGPSWPLDLVTPDRAGAAATSTSQASTGASSSAPTSATNRPAHSGRSAPTAVALVGATAVVVVVLGLLVRYFLRRP